MSSRVDLSPLAADRDSPETACARRARRSVVSRSIVPGLILVGFAGIVGWSARASFLPAKDVTVLPVIASRADFVPVDSPVFQAAGWIEPRPQPVVVTALTEGIIDELLVVEGQDVVAGQTIARLIRQDAEIEVRRAEADIRLRQAESSASMAELAAAKALREEPLPRLAEWATAEAELIKVETEIARLPALVRAAEAKRTFSKQEVDGKSRSGEAVPPILLQRAKSELEGATALLEEYQQQTKSLDRQRTALTKRRDILQRQLELKVDETRRVVEAEAQVKAGEARLQQAQAALDAAQLKLDRTEVKAKTSGRVLALLARPGSRLMGIDRAALVDASSVITMYDPASLQVRADVRLEDVPHVMADQKVRVATPACREPLTGRVLVATALTDIQKNTLQVKVALDDPPAVLKPDMLVQVTFLAAAEPAGGANASQWRLLLPRELIQNSGNGSFVWVADQAACRARRRHVISGSATADNLVEISSGLNVGDRVIVAGRESLADGVRIRVLRDDPTLGAQETTAATIAPAAIKSSQVRRTGGQE